MTPKNLLLFVATLCSCVLLQADGARILGFFPSPSKSHLMIHLAIADTLVEAGHDVTVIATQPNVYKHAKYTYVYIDGPKMDPNFANKIINDPQPMFLTFKGLLDTMMRLASETLSDPKMQKFLEEHGEGSFDLLLMGYFMNDFNLGLAAHFKCPIIIDFMIRPAFGINSLVGNPTEVAYSPILFGGFRQPMAFKERVLNFLMCLFEEFVMGTYMDYESERYYNLHFPADRYPPLSEVKKNISLILTNHHTESQGPIRPNVPALVEIGGIQIKEKPNPLPKDIAEVVDQAKQGFIYFSLGTVVQGTFLPRDKVKLMFDVLSKLPYLVIWKWGEGENPGKADNIIYRAWLPQDDILAHPNCKLFITHGGQGGVVESQYHGVPMVGIPFFGDQPTNMKNVVASGFGLSLDYLTLSADKFEQTIKEVLNNPKYSTAVKQYSKLYRDRPMTPRQLVVYWVEYVIRHHGAPHLQSPAVFMNRWQLLSLDVIGFILAVLAVVVGALVVTCRLLCCRGRSKVKQFNKVKKN